MTEGTIRCPLTKQALDVIVAEFKQTLPDTNSTESVQISHKLDKPPKDPKDVWKLSNNQFQW